MTRLLIALLPIAALFGGAAPAASAALSQQPMVLLKIKHVGEAARPVPVLFLARGISAASLVKNAVLEHQIYNLGVAQFEVIRRFWVNEVRESQSGPLVCGDVLAHGSFEIAARSLDGSLGFDIILSPEASAEHLRRFEKFLEERKIDRELTASLRAMLASL